MATLHFSFTCPINPPSASPVLSLPQVWTALQRKIRHPEEFMPQVIHECKVLSDEDGVVTRIVYFREGKGPGGKTEAKEVVRSFWPSWVDFEVFDNTHIRNVISHSAGLGDDSLQMTYMFEVRQPSLEGASQEEMEKELEKMRKMSQMAVESTVEKIREMVKDGRIAEDGMANFAASE